MVNDESYEGMMNSIMNDPKLDKRTFTKSEVIGIAQDTNFDLRDRALFTILYLSNSRISEIIRRLRKEQIVFTRSGPNEFMLFKELYTAKNRHHPSRTIPVNIQKERQLVVVVKEYINQFNDQNIIFPISRQRAWTLIKRMSKKKCHFLRHSRLTHLIVDYNLNNESIRRMAGWTDSRPMDVYAHLKWDDIADAMV